VIIVNQPAPATRRALIGPRRVLAIALIAGLAFVGFMFSEAQVAYADDTIGISGVPADGDGNADGRTRFSYSAEPGQQISDAYLVRNTGTTVQSYTVLSADAFNDANGEYALTETSAAPADIGAWVMFENGTNRLQFDLAPGDSRAVPFTLSVPAEASPGDHAGGIAASVQVPSGQVILDRRLATRMYLRVAGEVQAGLSIAGLSASYVGDWWNPFTGAVRVHYTVENTGNIALASNITVGASTWFGIPVGGEQGDGIPELLPGGTRTYETDLPGIASLGYLSANVLLNPFVEGDDETKDLPVPATSRDTMLIAPPWTVLILLALVGGFVAFRAWRRRVDAKRAAEWIAYTEAEAKRKAEDERESAPAGAGAGS
jgi:dihydroorotate dehydrogenase (fumarate)